MPPTSVRVAPLTGLPPSTFMRIILIGAAVGVVESLVGVFALDDDPFLPRTLYLVTLNCLGAGYGIVGYAAAWRIPPMRARFWTRVLAADLVVVIPNALTVWASTLIFGGPPGPLWVFLAYDIAFGFLLSGAFIATFVAPILDKAWECARDTAVTAAVSTLQPDFMDRLPFRLRGAALWALKAEDHYLRAITSRGEALIRMRLADAVKELQGVEGARCHRSWWIARGAVRDVQRADGRVRCLVLPNDREIPVSRSGAKDLIQQGWF